MATNTPNIQLRKVDDDIVTGDNVDIDLDLNANWDKVDTAVGDLQTDIDNLYIRFHARGGSVTGGSGSGVWSPLEFTTEEKDTAGGHDTSTNNTRYTAQVSGSYRVGGGARFSASSTGSRGCRVALNGAAISESETVIPATPGGACHVPSIPIHVDMGVGDYVEVEVWNNSGSTRTIDVGTMYVEYLGPI